MKRIIIATEAPASDGTIIKMDGITFKNPVPLTMNFKADNVIGSVEVFRNENVLEMNEINFKEHLDFYPAIGVQYDNDSIIIDDNGIKVVNKCKIFEVSLCSNPNVDSNIKTIREQLRINF